MQFEGIKVTPKGIEVLVALGKKIYIDSSMEIGETQRNLFQALRGSQEEEKLRRKHLMLSKKMQAASFINLLDGEKAELSLVMESLKNLDSSCKTNYYETAKDIFRATGNNNG